MNKLLLMTIVRGASGFVELFFNLYFPLRRVYLMSLSDDLHLIVYITRLFSPPYACRRSVTIRVTFVSFGRIMHVASGRPPPLVVLITWIIIIWVYVGSLGVMISVRWRFVLILDRHRQLIRLRFMNRLVDRNRVIINSEDR